MADQVSRPPWLRESGEGVLLFLRLQPGARRTALVGEHGGRLKLAVQAPPVQGRANEAVIAWLAERLEVAHQDVRITAGLNSRNKTLLVSGLGAARALERLLQM